MRLDDAYVRTVNQPVGIHIFAEIAAAYGLARLRFCERDRANRQDAGGSAGIIPCHHVGGRWITVVALCLHECMVDERIGTLQFAFRTARRIAGEGPSAESANQIADLRIAERCFRYV